MNFILSINPTVSNHYFCSKMTECGLHIIALFTHKNFPGYCKEVLNSKYYYCLILSGKDLESDIKNIKSYTNISNIICGIIGTEIDYAYSELLLSYLFPNSSNNPDTSFLRYKKYEMCEKLASFGLPASKQIKINLDNFLEDNLTYISTHFQAQEYPLIIKPNHGSAASVGVEFINSIIDLKNYIVNNNSGLFYHANELIIQENLKGNEYFVDSFSNNNEHQFSSVFKYSKEIINGKIISRYKDILSDDDIFSIEAKKYVSQSLTALEYKFGFAHTEIIYTNEGFKLVEVNPRVSGAQGTSQYISKLKHNMDQFDLLIDSIFNIKKIRNDSNKHYRCIHLYNRAFYYEQFNDQVFNDLPSFSLLKILQETGQPKNSDSIIDTIALIILEHQSLEKIEEDTLKIFQIEQDGKFVKF